MTMAFVTPGAGQAAVSQTVSGLDIVIPVKAPIFPKVFLGFWLIGWAMGEVFGASMLFKNLSEGVVGQGLFMIAWFGAWTVAGAFAILTFLWLTFGRERIGLDTAMLTHRREILGLGQTKNYDILHISNLRLAPPPSMYSMRNSFRPFLGSGGVAFDYGRSTHCFGASLEEADARYIIAEMCKRARSLCKSS